MLNSYGYLVKDYKPTAPSVSFHVLFLLRRLCIVISINLFDDLPYIQTILCSLSCMIVCIHLIIVRPYKDTVLNVILIMVELSICTCYSSTVLLVKLENEDQTLMWIMLGCTYLSYLLHSVLGYYKIIKIVSAYIRSCLKRRRNSRTLSSLNALNIR